MNPRCNTAMTKPSKPPKDGWGPRGIPDCYYTSRVLNSTGHYVRYVKKLRTLEEETRVALVNSKRAAKDKECIEFFSKCDRSALVNKVDNLVKLSLQSYDDDLILKRQRLKEVLRIEEEMDIRKLVEQVQSGCETVWKERMSRLAYLLAKRKEEHQSIFEDTHLSKCAHVLPCIIKLQAKEAEEIQLYQMREKQLRKLAEQEFDKMWHDVKLKESDTLAARMEYDSMERLRRDLEAKKFTLEQMEMKKKQRAREQEMLKREFLIMKAKLDEDNRKADEVEKNRKMLAQQLGRDKLESIKERQEIVTKRQAEVDYIDKTWDSLASQGLAVDRAKEARRIQKERDLDECNRKMVAMKNRVAETKFNSDPLILQEGQRLQDAKDLERCHRRLRAKQANKDTQIAVLQQGKEKREAVQEKEMMQVRVAEYEDLVTSQLEKLVTHKELTDAQARKMFQKDLLQQMEYNKLLKERAQEEALNESKKCEIAMDEYQQEIKKMLSRPFFSDQVHPFMKKMASGLKMRQMCPCGAPDYCRDPPAPEPLQGSKNVTK